MPEEESQSTARILGGKPAKLGQIPWHLLIKVPNKGGASLINDRWAVTAAHVVENVPQTSLQLYGGLIDGRTSTSPNTVVIKSEKIIIHPGFVRNVNDRTDFDNDIALIRFAARVNLGPNLLPICLPQDTSDLEENELGTVSGFGVTERGPTYKLKYADIGVYSLQKCQDTPNLSENKRTVFTDNMFCAGGEGKDSCEQDSGGPFVMPMLTGGTGPFHLAGIVSWGPHCWRTGQPYQRKKEYKGYYTKVKNYVRWITNTINATEKSLEQ